MIKLNYPLNGKEYFVGWRDTLIGPVVPANVPGQHECTFYSDVDFLREKEEESIGGDNSVRHLKVDGDLFVSPCHKNAVRGTSSHGVSYPNGITTTISGVPTTFNGGFFTDGRLNPTLVADGSVGALSALVREGEKYVIYTVSTKPPYGTFISIFSMTFVGMSNLTYIIEEHQEQYLLTTKPFKFDMVSVDEVLALCGLYSVVRKPPTFNYVRQVKYLEHIVTDNSTLSPRQVAGRVDAVAWVTTQFGNSIPEYDYGTLALEATERSRVNKVNMLAFLADLRNPERMAPKLKNLRKISKVDISVLRNASDDYLTVHYGVLPTVSDLKDIEAAARKIGPYLDKAGNQVYTAGHTQVDYTSSFRRESTQRIKLAVDGETSEFTSIMRRIDNVGMFPSYENIWDLIPFSFVVDWFTSVGDFLHDYDNLQRLDRLNIQYVTMSNKLQTQWLKFDDNDYLTGKLTMVQYHRWVSHQCPVPKLTFHTMPSTQSHWLESTALLMQRTHK